MAITYDDIANHAWKQVLAINTAASNWKDLGSFLNDKFVEDIIRHQFNNNILPHIKQLRFVAENPIPTPKLDKLAKDFNYTGLTAKDDFLKAVETDLGDYTVKALKKFEKGGFLGIAYDRTVWVQKNEMIDTVLHEIVHTLQWKHFGQKPFLSKYIEGYSEKIRVLKNADSAYFKNPPEVQAYKYQQEFLDNINTALSATYTLINGPTMTDMQSAGRVDRSKSEVANLVKKQPSLDINTAEAIAGMT